MREYNNSNIEEFIKTIRCKSITNIFPVKVFKVTYIENHYGNCCYYVPDYESERYNFTLDDAKNVCLENRKCGRQLIISEVIALYVESIKCRVLLFADIGGTKNFYLLCCMLREKPMVDTFILCMFMLSLFKKRSPLCINLFDMYQKEVNNSKIEYCNSLKSYSSEFCNGFLSWKETEYHCDNVNFIISEYIKKLK